MRLCCAVTIIEYGNKDVSQHVSPYFQRFKWWIFIRSAHKQLFKCAKENFKNLYHRKMKMFIRKTKCQDKLLSFVKWKFSNLKHICTNNKFNSEHEKFFLYKSFHTFVEHKERVWTILLSNNLKSNLDSVVCEIVVQIENFSPYMCLFIMLGMDNRRSNLTLMPKKGH